ncbi:MAG: LacI family DNA-binding transcriptional regulator [Lentisphaerota bacterium]
MRVTIKDVALATGVFPSTVSTVLNNKKHSRISAEKRDYIRKAAEEMGYRPNRQASCLRNKKKPAIGVFLPKWQTILTLQIIQGLTVKANELDLPLSFYFGLNSTHYTEFIDSMTNGRNSGIISYVPVYCADRDISLGKIKEYLDAEGRVIALNPSQISLPASSSIEMDEEHGGRLAAEYLARQECKSFAVIVYENPLHIQRQRAFQQALSDAGDNITVFASKGNEQSNREQEPRLSEFLRHCAKPCGLFLTSSSFTLNVLAAVWKSRFTIGQEIRIIGYDYSATNLNVPYFPEIVQPFYEMGRLAIEDMDRLLRGEVAISRRLLPDIRYPDQLLKPKEGSI